MALSFLFERDDDFDKNALQQGDVLQRTPELQQVVEIAHPYYATAPDYHFFMVLTQSCDLVRRGGKPPRSRYITLAAVRPLEIVMERLVSRYAFGIDVFPLLVCQKRHEIAVKQYLERLLHNSEHGLFFIRKGSHSAFAEDYCVFLALSIALRSEHYDACLQAKVAQLQDVFQAKVGWLAGNLYSRVGTPDFEDHEPNPEVYLDKFFEEVLYERTAWVSPEQRKQLIRMVKGRDRISETEAREILQQLKSDIEVVAERVADQLAQGKVLAGDVAKTKEEVINILVSDRVLRRMILEE